MSGRVLLAEDDRFLRKVGEAALRRRGFEVEIAVDGEEALAKARTVSPDLILLDVIMPKVQGFEVLARLKADPATKDIPVVMLTNLSQESDLLAALKAGAKSYLVKANNRADEMATAVETILTGMGK